MGETSRLGDWILRRLKGRDWSQADFARAIPTSTGTVSNWISGKRIPEPESCDKIADVLGLDVDDVLTIAGHRPEPIDFDPDDPRALLVARIQTSRLADHRLRDLRRYLDLWEQWDREDQEAARPIAFVDPSQGGRPKAGPRGRSGEEG